MIINHKSNPSVFFTQLFNIVLWLQYMAAFALNTEYSIVLIIYLNRSVTMNMSGHLTFLLHQRSKLKIKPTNFNIS